MTDHFAPMPTVNTEEEIFKNIKEVFSCTAYLVTPLDLVTVF
jgi:hypothetical protein